MAEQDFGALDWVRGEIEENLRSARVALEAFIETPDDSTLIRQCLHQLHQINSVLGMMELAGAGILSAEMRELAQALMNGEVSDVDGAYEALMQGMLQLPLVLERIQRESRDDPSFVIGLANDLRVVRGEQPLAGGAGAEFDLSALEAPFDGQALARFERRGGIALARKARTAYQRALVGCVRDPKGSAPRAAMQRVCNGLVKLCDDTPVGRFCVLLAGFAEVLHADKAELGPEDLGALRQVDSLLRRLVRGGAAQLDHLPPAQLARTLAERIAKAEGEGPARSAALELLGLGAGAPAEETVDDREARRAVAVNLRDEVAGVKDRLDLYARSEVKSRDDLDALLPALRQVSSTLAMLGAQSLVDLVNDQIPVLEGLLERDEVPEGELMEVAAALVAVEHGLEAMIATGAEDAAEAQVQEVHRVVLGEIRKGLQEVKDAVTDFQTSRWEHERLREVPELLASVRGALVMVPLERAADVVQRCRDYALHLIEDRIVPEWQAFDRFTEAISGIEYFVERLLETTATQDLRALEYAEESARALAEADEEVPLSEFEAEIEEPPTEAGAEPVAQTTLLDDAAADAPGGSVVTPTEDSFDLERLAGELSDAEPAEALPDDDAGDGPLGPDPLAGLLGGEVTLTEPSAEPAEEPTSSGEAVPAAEAVAPEVDPDILEVFVEEMDEVLQAMAAQLPRWRANLDDEEALAEVRRGFHTLKGSGRMVGAEDIGELCWSVENMLNRVIDGTVSANAGMLTVIDRVLAMLPEMRAAFAEGRVLEVDPRALAEQADVLASGGELSELEGEDDDFDLEALAAEEEEERALAAKQRGDGGFDLDAALEDERVAPELSAIAEDDMLELFIDEAAGHLEVLRELAGALRAGEPVRIDTDAYRAGHTIRGSAAMAEANHVMPVADAVNDALTRWQQAGTGLPSEVAQALAQAIDALGLAIAEGDTPEVAAAVQAATEGLVAAEARYGTVSEGGARELLDLPDIELIVDADVLLAQWADGVPDMLMLTRLEAVTAALAEGAAQHDLDDVAALCRALAEQHALPEPDIAVLRTGHAELVRALDALAVDQRPVVSAEVLARLGAVGAAAAEGSGTGGDAPDAEPAASEASDEDSQSAPTPEARPEPLSAEVLGALPDDADFDLLEVFFEEAAEISESIDQSVHEWSAAPGNEVFLETLLRGLHTLKGGARMAGLSALGEAAHELESELVALQQGGGRPEPEFLADLQLRIDRLVAGVAHARTAARREGAESSAPAPSAPPAEPAEAEPAASAEPEAGPVSEVATEGPAHRPPPQEMVRVSSGVLEMLVNLAGEASIARGRIEQEISDFGGSLEELESTIERLREQLRRLEIEIEAQVVYREERTEGRRYEDFDPLEMDRYSQLQALSRALSESASDLLDLKETLANRARDAETLLLQQARINTELQEGLMRTRMVPFARLVPRLRRIVRQIGRELRKDVEFAASEAEGELDRNVLERMIAPLEHMLRNAVDHGIEAPEQREAAGKPRAGRIELRLAREGGDVVLELTDDGAGIDVDAVRERAIERGLMAPNAQLADEAIMQFVLAPGFSTASEVTQISGRGVGMDVVHSEVKQLGGSVHITSERGAGTRITVRLPFTVSVNRALMVSVGDDVYAIPLNMIAGIVRVVPQELERLYETEGAPFDYAGERYSLRYLGAYVGRDQSVRQDLLSVPVILVRSGEQAMALHVDGVQGSREIVVKSLGPQFAGVAGISGATILGDGSVVVILDLLALIRNWAPVESAAEVAEAEELATCVLVVDDSVTVRKVTSRLLERHGFEVLLAKDGVEAMAQLQERRPDVMLLDIEMPRMDGFEVARQVREDARMSAMPIIMISSRSGAKHQQRARDLGVNHFLGKPFQENELLEVIDTLVAA